MARQRYAHFKDFSAATLPFAEKKRIWLEISNMTEAAFDAMMARDKARQHWVPKLGTLAPDFTAERLTPERRRTGEYVTLSALKGRPVALCFGSYT